MYASNEEEDWIYLHETPPMKTVKNEKCSRSTKSNRSISLSSISSSEPEYVQNDHVLLPSPSDGDRLPSEQLISTATVEENSPVKDGVNAGFQSREPSTPLSNTRRRRSGTNTQQTQLLNSEVLQSTRTSRKIKRQKRLEQYRNKHDPLVSCACLVVLMTLPLIFGQTFTYWDQPTMTEIAKELVKTNERLNVMTDIPIANFEEKLTKQFDEKLQKMINQQMTWHEHEKSVFITEIRGLRKVLHKTQQNSTNSIAQLNKENERLREQLRLLEPRSRVGAEHYSKTCLKGGNCAKPSRSILDKLLTNLFERTTAVNLSGLFEHLSASVSNIVDHRHEYLKASKRKLTDLTRPSTTRKVQTSFRRSLENLSSSFRKAKSTYTSWIHSHVPTRIEYRPKAPAKFPWRWTFSRGYHRGHWFFPSPTKEQVCYSKLIFPMNKICSMKSWMEKFFRF